MRFTSIRFIGGTIVLAGLLAGPIAASPPLPALNQPETTEVNQYFVERSSKLLQDLQEVASDLNRSAESLGTFARTPQLSWQSHAYYLNDVRHHINKSGVILRELQSIDYAVALWQQQAVDTLHPVAVELASHTEAAIQHLNENRASPLVPEYKERLTAIADSAAELRETVNNYLDYAETQRKLNHLEAKLEIAGT